jgi:hypothetical protein
VFYLSVKSIFCDTFWGKATHNYAKLACILTKAKFNVIIKKAQEFVKPTQTWNKTTNAMEVIDVDDVAVLPSASAISDSVVVPLDR